MYGNTRTINSSVGIVGHCEAMANAEEKICFYNEEELL